jgi:beta-1,2-mannosidase
MRNSKLNTFNMNQRSNICFTQRGKAQTAIFLRLRCFYTSLHETSFPLIGSLLFFAITVNSFQPVDLHAQSDLPAWTLGPFVRPAGKNPVLSPNAKNIFNDPMTGRKIAWESNDVFNPAAAMKGNKIYVIYRAEDKSGIAIGERTSRLGLAESSDGIKMQRRKIPVMFPTNDDQKEFEWTGGCEDPRVAVTEDGTYLMFYTQWNKKVPRIGVATSRDLVSWKKHGPAFQDAHNGRFFNMASKSASIITKLVNGKQVIAKVNGKYMMYWGEHFVNPATSDDLVNWQPMLDDKGELLQLISPRKDHFDSELTECGPPAVMTNDGILLLYNGKNKATADGDERYTPNTYAAGQVLFDLATGLKPIQRLDLPFFVPTEPFEKSGQYPAGTVFLEGLVYFKNKWFLYYGCADSRVGVAIYNPSSRISIRQNAN